MSSVYWCNIGNVGSTVVAVGGAAGGHQLRQLQDDDHDAMAPEPKWRAGLQCMRAVLQTAQCKYYISEYYLLQHNTLAVGNKVSTIRLSVWEPGWRVSITIRLETFSWRQKQDISILTFFLTDSEAHKTSYWMCIEGKDGRNKKLTSFLHLVPRLRIHRGVP